MPKGNINRAGHIGHHRFVLLGLIYYEFNGGVTNDSYVYKIGKRTRLLFPPRGTYLPESMSLIFFSAVTGLSW